jgi:hypothetical protein
MTSRDPEERPTALEVATRARSLDAGPGEPEVTALSVDRAGVGDASVPPRPPLPPTPGAPSPESAPAATLILPTERVADVSTGGGIVAEGGEADLERADARPRRRVILVVGALLLVAAIVAIVVALLWNANAPTEPEQPDLPQIGEPIDSHLRDLLDAVTP